MSQLDDKLLTLKGFFKRYPDASITIHKFDGVFVASLWKDNGDTDDSVYTQARGSTPEMAFANLPGALLKEKAKP